MNKKWSLLLACLFTASLGACMYIIFIYLISVHSLIHLISVHVDNKMSHVVKHVLDVKRPGRKISYTNI
jgi:hypothetical protein